VNLSKSRIPKPPLFLGEQVVGQFRLKLSKKKFPNTQESCTSLKKQWLKLSNYLTMQNYLSIPKFSGVRGLTNLVIENILVAWKDK
jgi:hypothetical protein